jgi:hypothetical protein
VTEETEWGNTRSVSAATGSSTNLLAAAARLASDAATAEAPCPGDVEIRIMWSARDASDTKQIESKQARAITERASRMHQLDGYEVTHMQRRGPDAMYVAAGHLACFVLDAALRPAPLRRVAPAISRRDLTFLSADELMMLRANIGSAVVARRGTALGAIPGGVAFNLPSQPQ